MIAKITLVFLIACALCILPGESHISSGSGSIGVLSESGSIVGLWHFDEGEGLTAYDSSGYGKNGALLPIVAKGKFGNALKFDGVDDYVNIGTQNKLSVFTIEAWVNFTTYTQKAYAGIVFLGDAAKAWGLAVCNNYIFARISDGSSKADWNIEPLNVTNYPAGWHHLVLVDNSTHLVYYKDGNYVGSKAITITNSGSDQLAIGRWGSYNGPDAYFKGVIDEVCIRNEAWSPRDITVTSVTPDKNVIGWAMLGGPPLEPIGWSMNISVTVENQGIYPETDVPVSLYSDSNLINQTTVPSLPGKANINLTFTFDPRGVPYGNYTIRAEAGAVPGEIDTLDNTLTSTITVTVIGDINGDGWVDGVDLTLMGFAWGARSPEWPNYNPNCDFNADGTVDGIDLFFLGIKWGTRPKPP